MLRSSTGAETSLPSERARGGIFAWSFSRRQRYSNEPGAELRTYSINAVGGERVWLGRVQPISGGGQWIVPGGTQELPGQIKQK